MSQPRSKRAQSQEPPQTPYFPQPFVTQGQYPVQHNVHLAHFPMSSTANPQGHQPHFPQPPHNQVYNMGTGPQYLPPPNKNMTLNHQQPVFQAGPGVPVNQQGMPVNQQGMPVNQQGTPVQAQPHVPTPQSLAPHQNQNFPRPQATHRVTNNNPSTQYVPANSSPAGRQMPGRLTDGSHPTQYAPGNIALARPQMPHPVANSNSSAQFVPTSTPAGAYPGPYQLGPESSYMPPKAPLTPQATAQSPAPPPTPPMAHPMAFHGNVPPAARKPSPASRGNSQVPAQNYGQIINGHFARPAPQTTGYQAAGPSPQTSSSTRTPTPVPAFNGGKSPQFMPPGRASPNPTRPVPQPITRYSLQSNGQIDPRTVQGITQNPLAGPKKLPKDGSNPPGNSMPPPATNEAAIPNPKRPADQPSQALPQQPTKKQKTSVPPSPKQTFAPAPPAEQPLPADKMPPQVYDPLEPLPATWAAEPQHLPDHELARIETTFVVEPDVGKPRPEDKVPLAWDQAVDAVVKIMKEDCKRGRLLRPKPLEKLRQLTDAIEEYVARRGRRPLLVREAEDLLTVRYIRVIEDGIWDGAFDHIPARDYDITAKEDKERVVREAWDKRAGEYRGPSMQEAQRQIFKYAPPPRAKQFPLGP